MEQRVGSCSICGGDVTGIRGAWMSINPPPPDKCSKCGAVSRRDVIEMHPAPKRSETLGESMEKRVLEERARNQRRN